MEHIDWQLARFRERRGEQALVREDRVYTYGDVLERYEHWDAVLRDRGVAAGDCAAVKGDFTVDAVAALLAVIGQRGIVVPLAPDSRDQHDLFREIAEVDWDIDSPTCHVRALQLRKAHPLLERLRETGEPGLVLFSSGSTGRPKAILHALPALLGKFRKPRHCMRTVSMLLFDHIGGFNTLMYTLANGGCLISPADRSVATVCAAVERHRAELLPTSPSFLNLMLLAKAHEQHDLSSLKLVTYGTEVMPERTLRLANEALPRVRFQQTYGLSEIGILRSKSLADNSLMVKVGGEDYRTKVVDGRLFVQAKSSMLGYLNAENPFDEEGWFDTGDSVIQEGDHLRILGRESEIINVGGQKVYPAEVEQVIAELPGVVDVLVAGEDNPLLGKVVKAVVQMNEPAPAREMKRAIRNHCRGRLQPFMIPTKVEVVSESQINYRFKKIRRATAGPDGGESTS